MGNSKIKIKEKFMILKSNRYKLFVINIYFKVKIVYYDIENILLYWYRFNSYFII